jgi:hypothetical protein
MLLQPDLPARPKILGHKLYVDNSSSELLDGLHTDTVRINRQTVPESIGQKMKLKWGNIETTMG